MRKIDLDLENSIFSHDLCLRGVKGPLAPNAALHVAFPLSRQGRHTEVVISELHTWPVRTPVNASPASLRTQAHDSGPKWCATPFLCGSLIRYSLPVYPGAFLDHFIRSIQQRLRNGETDLLRRFQIDHQVKLRRLLDRQIGGLGTLQDSVHVIGYAPVAVRVVPAVGHEPTGICIWPG